MLKDATTFILEKSDDRQIIIQTLVSNPINKGSIFSQNRG